MFSYLEVSLNKATFSTSLLRRGGRHQAYLYRVKEVKKLDWMKELEWKNKIVMMYFKLAQCLNLKRKRVAQNTTKTSKNTLDIGVAYGLLGKHDKVIDTLKKYIKKRPYWNRRSLNIGVAYFNLGEYKKALRYFAMIIELNDRDKISGDYRWNSERGDYDRCAVFSNIATSTRN